MRPPMPRDTWRVSAIPGRSKQTLRRQAVRRRWGTPCVLLLQMVPFQSNVDVATEVLLRHSSPAGQLCISSAMLSKNACMLASLSSLRSGGIVISPLPGSRVRSAQGAFGEENGPVVLKA